MDKKENNNSDNLILLDKSFKDLVEWLLVNKRTVFLDADISKDSKLKIVRYLGYSSDLIE